MEDLKGLLCFVDLSRKQKVLYSCCFTGKILSPSGENCINYRIFEQYTTSFYGYRPKAHDLRIFRVHSVCYMNLLINIIAWYTKTGTKTPYRQARIQGR